MDRVSNIKKSRPFHNSSTGKFERKSEKESLLNENYNPSKSKVKQLKREKQTGTEINLLYM